MNYLNDSKAGFYQPTLSVLIKSLFSSYSAVNKLDTLVQDITILDISFYQLKADFGIMKNNCVDGVIIRAGQNLWADSQAETYMTNAEKANMPFGSYWFYDSRVEPKRQAEKWKAVLGNHKTQLMCWADYEETYAGTYSGWRKLYDFLEACKQLMPDRKFGIYTGYYYWISHSPSTTAESNYFAQYPLWLAWYTQDMSIVKIPKPWTKITMWQHSASGDGTKYGVGSKEVDMNRFIGTRDEFNCFFGFSSQQPPQPEPIPEPLPEPTPEPQPVVTRVRVIWDDENPDLGYKSRTQSKGWKGPKAPPAVYRFYPEMREKSGDYRVNLASPFNWKNAIIRLDGKQGFNYLTGPARATYNKTGWPQQAYITMSGNVLEGEFVGDWFKFKTLKQNDVFKAGFMTKLNNPQYVHNFTCVKWNNKTKKTDRIPSTGTPRGQVYFYLVTKEGYAYIPKRFVKSL